ncbi:MAG: pantoate--beta-alanine ligase [Desulfobacterales bacterium]|nr:pantoate--beta-alanine ligase [Desulfobacterales bacterium]
MQTLAGDFRRQDRTVAFVPTMGYLHDGHLSLLAAGRQMADILVVSIFVNPTQFGPGEDYDNYPRDPERDRRLAENAGTDVLFMPEKDQLYPEGYETYVTQTHLPKHLCGLSRPTHFSGVTTIVAKLFNIVKPHYAVFGEKDYQQLAIVRKMTADLNFDTRIVGAPIVRESDGLALSSRNKYLTPQQRQSALSLNRALAEAQRMVAEGETRAETIIEKAVQIITAQPETEIDYVRICDPETLEDAAVIDHPVLMALAVHVGQTRLLDNTMLALQSGEQQ